MGIGLRSRARRADAIRARDPLTAPLIVCALSTGMRRGELLAFLWMDVDFPRHELVVRPAVEKAGRGRASQLTADLENELRGLREKRADVQLDQSDSVFVDSGGEPINRSGLRSMFASAVTRCTAIPLEKKQRVTFHCLRHTAASLMVAAGVPLFDVAKILGHSTLAVTMRYAHFAPEAERVAIDRLGRALGFGGTTPKKAVEGGSARSGIQP